MSRQLIDPPSAKGGAALPPAPQKASSVSRFRKTGKVLLWIAGIALVGFLLIGFLVPWIATREARKMTGESFHFGFLVISPNGMVSISARGAQELNRQFHLDAARVRLDWWAALLKRVQIGYLDLKEARFDIERTKAGELIVNGVNLAKLAPPSPEVTAENPAQETKPGKPWGLGLGRLSLSNLAINYQESNLKANLVIRRFFVGSAESWHAESKTPFDAELTLNGAEISLKGTLTPFSESPELETSVNVLSLPLDWTAPLLKSAGVSGVKGSLGVAGKLWCKFEKDKGILDAKWDGGVTLSNISALYSQKPAESKAKEQKFRLFVNGPIETKGVKIHITQKPSALTYAAQSVKNQGPFWLEVDDESFRRPPKVRLEPLEFNVQDISLMEPDLPTVINVKMGLGKYGRIALAGKITPFAQVLNGNLTANLQEIDAAPFTAYSEKYAGSRIQTGVLNLETKASIKNDLLDAKSSVLLKRLEFQYFNKEREEEQTAKVGIPLNIFLSLLKDKNGDIRLDVPMTGPVRDPSLGIGSLIAKLVGKAAAFAAQKAAESFFPPLKMIELAGSAAQFAAKWRFDPVLFKSSGLEILPESSAYLSEVGAKLQERPQVRLTICGFGTRADLGSVKNEEKKLPPLTLAERDRLVKLATDRAASVKDFLVNHFGISSERLLICSPAAEDKAGSLPRATLSL